MIWSRRKKEIKISVSLLVRELGPLQLWDHFYVITVQPASGSTILGPKPRALSGLETRYSSHTTVAGAVVPGGMWLVAPIALLETRLSENTLESESENETLKKWSGG